MDFADVLVYDGTLSKLNNLGDNLKVAEELTRYNIVVLGELISSSAHGDYSNVGHIFLNVFDRNPELLLIGQVSAQYHIDAFKTRVDDWIKIGARGIYASEAGYDYGKKRAEFNERVQYLKEKNLSCLAGVMNPNHVVGTEEDPDFMNETYNPEAVESLLGENDGLLLESLVVDTESYHENSGYAKFDDVINRVKSANEAKKLCGVRLFSTAVIDNSPEVVKDRQALIDFAYRAAWIFGMEGHATSSKGYGGVDHTVEHSIREELPDGLAPLSIGPGERVQATYGDKVISLDFSKESQSSSVVSPA